MMVHACQFAESSRCFDVQGFSKRLALAFVASIVLAAVSYSQVDTATVSGVITDQSGAAVAGAEVQVTNTDTNVSVTATSNESGVYVVTGIKPGPYRIGVKKEGFNQIDLTGFTLNVQDDISRNFVLRVGSTSESISVEGRAESVETSGSVSTVIDRGFVSQLPLNGRSFNTLLQLTPGVVIAPTSTGAQGQFSINGQRTNSNYFQVDGVSADFGVPGAVIAGFTYQSGGGGSQAFNVFGGTSSLVSVDALQEFRVETSSFAPEYGHTPGGQAIIETRSGTNDFHGDVFDYFRNTVLDANDWFSNQLRLGRTPEHQNDFGGVVGGPIIGDKTFFFFSYEGLRLLQPQTHERNVPSLSARSSAVPGAAPYIDAFPQPNGPVTSNPNIAMFTAAYDNRISSDATSIRVDHRFNGKWLLFGRFNYAPSQLITRNTSGFSQVNTTQVNTTTTTVGLTGTLTPSITNSFRANYSTQDSSQTAALDSFGSATPLNSNLLLPSPLSPKDSSGQFVIFDIGFYEIGAVYGVRENQWNFVDSFSMQKGKHQLKAGVDYRLLDFRHSGNPAQLSDKAFSTANFTSSGQVQLFSYGVQRPATIRFQNLGLYVQDAWKLNPRLTLTYGLRWEFNPAPSAVGSTQLVSWENTSTPSQINIASPGTPPWKNVYHDFAPRVGVAYQLNSRGDFVLRGGAGIFYDLGTSVFTNLTATYPNTFFNVVHGNTSVPINASQFTPPPPSTQPPFLGQFFAFANNMTPPRSYQWNVALEKSFGSQQSLSATYVGQVGRNLLRSIDVLNYDPTIFPTAGAIGLTLNGDTSDYHALQIQYRRRLSQGVQALLNYTWSHCIDSNSDDSFPISTGTAIPAQDDRGNCAFDVRNNFTGAVTYSLPRFTRRAVLSQIVNGWSVDGIVQVRGGFPVDVTYFNFSFPGVPGGVVSARPDRVPGQPFYLSGAQCASVYQGLGQLTTGQSCPGGKGLNPNAFDSVTPMNAGRQGTLPRNAVPGFGATQADMSIMRKFPITERVNLQFRADAFNVFNHPNFGAPDSNLFDLGSSFGLTSQMLNSGLGGLTPLYQIGGPRSLQLSLKLFF